MFKAGRVKREREKGMKNEKSFALNLLRKQSFPLSNNRNLPCIKRLTLDNHFRDYKYISSYHNSHIYIDF